MLKNFDVVLFDLGQVVFEADESLTCKYWSKLLGFDVTDIYEKCKDDPMYYEFEKGNIAPIKYYEYVISRLKINLSYKDFVDGLDSIYKDAFLDVEEEIKKLKGLVKIIALTNTNEIHSEVWPNLYKDVLKNFDAIYSSSVIHMRKPDIEIYEYVLKDLNVDASKVLYFDDNQNNINAAKSLGITSYLVTNPKVVCETLKALRK